MEQINLAMEKVGKRTLTIWILLLEHILCSNTLPIHKTERERGKNSINVNLHSIPPFIGDIHSSTRHCKSRSKFSFQPRSYALHINTLSFMAFTFNCFIIVRLRYIIHKWYFIQAVIHHALLHTKANYFDYSFNETL